MPRKSAKAQASPHGLNFTALVEAVRQVHEQIELIAERNPDCYEVMDGQLQNIR